MAAAGEGSDGVNFGWGEGLQNLRVWLEEGAPKPRR